MADLDDFFAKKDRKKSKGKKFTTTEEIAKKLEEKKIEKPKKEKLTFQSSLTGQAGEEVAVKAREEEEEWKEFEEEKKDYTGLKIQNLTMQEQVEEDSEQGDGEGEMEENEQGEMVRRKKGPWRSIENEPAAATPPAAPKTESAPPASSVTNSGKYVPPSMRHQAPVPTRTPRGKTVAPDIMNTEFFPTLSAATNETPTSWGKKKHEGAFEEVRNSKSHSNRNETRESRSLEIGNKFGALQTETS